jgi:hypothetical protein
LFIFHQRIHDFIMLKWNVKHAKEQENPMTNEEKFNAIIDRCKANGWNISPEFVSMMVVTGYLADMEKAGIVESAFKVTPLGSRVIAICEEFDWKPTNEDFLVFVMEMVDEYDKAPFMHLLKRYRDDREGLLIEFKKCKDEQENI